MELLPSPTPQSQSTETSETQCFGSTASGSGSGALINCWIVFKHILPPVLLALPPLKLVEPVGEFFVRGEKVGADARKCA